MFGGIPYIKLQNDRNQFNSEKWKWDGKHERWEKIEINKNNYKEQNLDQRDTHRHLHTEYVIHLFMGYFSVSLHIESNNPPPTPKSHDTIIQY